MMKLGDLCGGETERLTAADDLMIDYIDISSVSNESKSIIGKQTLQSRVAPSRAQRIIKADDILVSTVRPNLNAVAVYDGSFENLAVASTGFCVLRCKSGVSHRFVFNICKSNAFIKAMTEQATGASYPAVNDRIIRAFEVPDLDYESQTRLAGRLDSIQLIIDLRKQQLRELDDLIKARFVEMFGTGHDGRCKTAMIGNICKFQQGTQIPVEVQIEEQRDGYKRFLRIIDYTQAPQPPRFVNVEGREIDEKSVVIVRYGATAGFVGRGYSGILANNLFEVIPNETFLGKDFLYLALKHGTFERDIHEKAFGAAMPALSFSMMNDIPIVVPSNVEQKRFVAFVSQVDKSKLSIQASLDQLETLKQSLMQKYFGG